MAASIWEAYTVVRKLLQVRAGLSFRLDALPFTYPEAPVRPAPQGAGREVLRAELEWTPTNSSGRTSTAFRNWRR